MLPLVYDELHKLAAAKLAQEKPGQTLQATALVHEAYMRLVKGDTNQNSDGLATLAGDLVDNLSFSLAHLMSIPHGRSVQA